MSDKSNSDAGGGGGRGKRPTSAEWVPYNRRNRGSGNGSGSGYHYNRYNNNNNNNDRYGRVKENEYSDSRERAVDSSDEFEVRRGGKSSRNDDTTDRKNDYHRGGYYEDRKSSSSSGYGNRQQQHWQRRQYDSYENNINNRRSGGTADGGDRYKKSSKYYGNNRYDNSSNNSNVYSSKRSSSYQDDYGSRMSGKFSPPNYRDDPGSSSNNNKKQSSFSECHDRGGSTTNEKDDGSRNNRGGGYDRSSSFRKSGNSNNYGRCEDSSSYRSNNNNHNNSSIGGCDDVGNDYSGRSRNNDRWRYSSGNNNNRNFNRNNKDSSTDYYYGTGKNDRYSCRSNNNNNNSNNDGNASNRTDDQYEWKKNRHDEMKTDRSYKQSSTAEYDESSTTIVDSSKRDKKPWQHKKPDTNNNNNTASTNDKKDSKILSASANYSSKNEEVETAVADNKLSRSVDNRCNLKNTDKIEIPVITESANVVNTGATTTKTTTQSKTVAESKTNNNICKYVHVAIKPNDAVVTTTSSKKTKKDKSATLEGTTSTKDSSELCENKPAVEKPIEESEMNRELREKQLLEHFIEDAKARSAGKQQNRRKYEKLSCCRLLQDDKKKSSNQSSVKKNTAFIRKLRNFSEQQYASLRDEMTALNLEKYISEIAAALVETKLKLTDVASATDLCGLIYESYPEFAKVLFEYWQKTFVAAAKKDDRNNNNNNNNNNGSIAAANPKDTTKLRADLRFYSELLTNGILPAKDGFALLRTVLGNLVGADKDAHANAAVLLSFGKYSAGDYVESVPRKIRQLAEKYRVSIPSTIDTNLFEKQSSIATLLTDYYRTLCSHMSTEYEQMKEVEKQNKKILQTKGEINGEQKDKLELLRNSFHKLQASANSFSELLDRDIPEIPPVNTKATSAAAADMTAREDDLIDDENTYLSLLASSETDMMNFVETGTWEHEETQKFYEDFPNVSDYLSTITNTTTTATATASVESSVAVTDDGTNNNNNNNKPCNKNSNNNKRNTINSGEQQIQQNNNNNNNENGKKTAEILAVPISKAHVDDFLKCLPLCVNKERIDNAAIDFLMNYNNKTNRRHIVKTLYAVPRTRLDLLPLYARFVAILNPIMPDIAKHLNAALTAEFKYLVQKKDQINIETKIKNVRFIGELVKFRLFAKSDGVQCLQELLNDFTHHHIEMACNFLETAGRFLYNSADAHYRIRIFLEQTMRKKQVSNLDWRYGNMIENAYYHVIPPESNEAGSAGNQKKKKNTLEAFLHKTLYDDLTDDEHVQIKALKSIRRLDWTDKTVAQTAVNYLSQAWNVRYLYIGNLANLLAGLVEYQEFVGTEVVDNVMEDIRFGLEWNSVRMNQRRLSTIRYFGELYNYRLIESADVFKMLYMLIMYDIVYESTNNNTNNNDRDPPSSTFRLRLICALLDTCGYYFDRGLSRTRLDVFLIFFQHYYAFKFSHPVWTIDNPFPIDVRQMVEDTIHQLRPSLTIVEDYEQAERMLMKVQRDFANSARKYYDVNSTAPWSAFAVVMMAMSSSSTADSKEDASTNVVNISSSNDDDRSDEDDDLNYSCGEFISSTTTTAGNDDDFTDAFEQMLNKDLKARANDNTVVKPIMSNITVPYQARRTAATKKKTCQQETDTEINDAATIDKKLNLMLILRKGHKQQYKNVQLSQDSKLALNLKSKKEEQRLEREKVKQLTLDMNQRLQLEEDYYNKCPAAETSAVASGCNDNTDDVDEYYGFDNENFANVLTTNRNHLTSGGLKTHRRCHQKKKTVSSSNSNRPDSSSSNLYAKTMFNSNNDAATTTANNNNNNNSYNNIAKKYKNNFK